MTLAQALAVLRARWRLGATVFLLVTVSTLLAALLQPSLYHARASVVVDARPDPLSASGPGLLSVAAYMATQVDIVRSDRVAQAALARLSPNDRRRLLAHWAPGLDDPATADLALRAAWAKALDVTPSRDSTVLAIGFDARDAALAAALANAAAQAYIDVALQLRIEPARQFAGFFDSRVQAARERLSLAQSRLREFQSRHGLVAGDERLDLETQRLTELSSQLVRAQAQAGEAASRQAQAGGDQAERLPEVLNHPLLAQLKAEVGRHEAQLQQLATRLGDRHPQLQEARAELELLRARLAEETRRVGAGVGVSERIQRRHEAGLRSALDEQRARMVALKSVRDEAQVLRRDVDQAQRALDALEQRLQQTRLESQSTQGAVNPLSAAVPPLQASSPRLLLQGLLGALLGVLLAVSVVLGLELRSRRVWDADDLQSALGLPLLVSVPSREPARPVAAALLRPAPLALASGD